MNIRRELAFMIVALAAVLATAFPAATQSSLEDIRMKLVESSALQRRALQTLSSDPGRAEQLISDAYAQLQAAHSAMVIRASGMKFPDPLFAFNDTKAREALALLQTAGDTLKVRDQSTAADSIGVARNRLDQALRLTNLLAGTF